MTKFCDGCEGALVPGVRANGWHYDQLVPERNADVLTDVERCDACALFEGDLEAAAALVTVLGTGRVHYEFDPDGVDCEGTQGTIAFGTSPWIVVEEAPGPPIKETKTHDD